ncbi:MAG: glycoside hydrolase family 16 protein [Acidimicrobiia bacterium]|nr:glycoside hydrolase family 16 protein [Acidimicrobiia bacterium]
MFARVRLQTARLLLVLTQVVACGGDRPPAAPTAPSAIPGSGNWMLVFSDEFDAPGALDSSKWGYELGYVRNNEAQYYTSRPANVRAEAGVLVIESLKEAYQGYGYTSASINTLGRFEFLYGRVEVRAKLPTGNGAWPAIWMLGTNRTQVGWPTCGEIDIMEYVGFDPLRVHGSIHTAAYSRGTHKTASINVANPWDAFHVYAMEWYPDRIEIFVDGQKYFTFLNEGTGTRTWPFDQPQYLLINLAIGGSWGGQRGIDDSRFPHRYLVDYVRIYQQR